ncbi:MAG: DUF1080 domain-containing protein [Anaerolineae bacterium]|nr:DUF1080 domain-containing protein [Anaerolineae bacterium]
MNKKIALISLLLIGVLASCSVIPQFQQAREQYVETRTAELLAEMPTTEPLPTEVVEATPKVEPTVEPTAEVTEEATEEPTEEATVEATEEVTATATEEGGEVDAESKAMTQSYDPKVYLGDASWSDNMTAVGNWPLGTDLSAATYDSETLMITSLSDKFAWRIATTEALGDAYIEATFKVGECAGADSYGIIFRVPENTGYNRGYLYGITCDGKYSLRSWDGMTGASGVMTWLQQATESSLIKSGKNQTNRLGIMAVGDRLIMYINGEKVGEVSDNMYSSGFFGIFIKRDKTQDLTIKVDDVGYWKNPTVK